MDTEPNFKELVQLILNSNRGLRKMQSQQNFSLWDEIKKKKIDHKGDQL